MAGKVAIQAEQKPGDKPGAVKTNKLRADLVRLGYKASEINALVKDGATYDEICAALIAKQRTAKKR